MNGNQSGKEVERYIDSDGLSCLDNGILKVLFDKSLCSFSVLDRDSGHVFIRDARFPGTSGINKMVEVDDKRFGRGRAIELVYPSGNIDRVMLFPDMKFALFTSVLHNSAEEIKEKRNVGSIRASLDLGKRPSDLRAFGTGGLTGVDKHKGSYAYLAIVDPETRNGVVAGWLTHDKGSGVLFSTVDQDTVVIQGQVDYGRLRVRPGESQQTEVLAVGYFDDARIGLEHYADAVARVYSIKLPSQPCGYCTWYSNLYGGASDEVHLKELVAFADNHLKRFGFEFVQIDDNWQKGRCRNGPAKDFTSHNPEGPFPSGMKVAADGIKAHGLIPGIWFMPFAGDHEDPLFREHMDWFVKRENGEPYETSWGGTSLDMTHPGAREHLRSVVHRLAHDWGYRYFKMDGLWTGTATEQIYINDEYREDGIGDAVFHNPDKTNIEAYRDGLRLVRETAGTEVFLLGCCVSQNMRTLGGSFGLVDAMRIGPDNGSTWPEILRGPIYGSRNYFLHGRVWYNDPDTVYVRSSMPLEHARLICSWVAVSGQLTVNSDWLPTLPPERLDILRRVMPAHGLLPRPVDLFESDIPRIWLLTAEGPPRRDVIALYNWDSETVNFDYPVDRIGLSPDVSYVAFDYWQDAFLPPFKGNLRLSVLKESCRILAVRPALDRPQLISTSRHVTQGIIDVLEETWDEAGKVLSGKSKVVANDPYELRIVALASDTEWSVESVEVSDADCQAGVKVAFREANGLIRVTINSPSSREVCWYIHFTQTEKPTLY